MWELLILRVLIFVVSTTLYCIEGEHEGDRYAALCSTLKVKVGNFDYLFH